MSFRLPITAASYFARRGGRSPPPPGFTACLCPLNVFEIVNPSVRICPWREGPVDGLRAARTRMIDENPFLIALQKPILVLGHAPLIQDCPSTSLSVWSCTKGRAALYLLVDVRSCWWRRLFPRWTPPRIRIGCAAEGTLPSKPDSESSRGLRHMGNFVQSQTCEIEVRRLEHQPSILQFQSDMAR